MAVTINDISPAGSVNRKVFEVLKSADGDSAAVIAHGLGVTPEEVIIVARGQKCYATGATQQNPSVGVVDATNVNIAMATGAGSADGTKQFDVIVRRPHSLVR